MGLVALGIFYICMTGVYTRTGRNGHVVFGGNALGLDIQVAFRVDARKEYVLGFGRDEVHVVCVDDLDGTAKLVSCVVERDVAVRARAANIKSGLVADLDLIAGDIIGVERLCLRQVAGCNRDVEIFPGADIAKPQIVFLVDRYALIGIEIHNAAKLIV